MNPSRWRLAGLWLSQLARVLADNWLRVFILLELERPWGGINQAWHLIALLWMLPALVLAPFNGAVSNSQSKRLVLSAAAALGLAAVLGSAAAGLPWIVCWQLLAISFAVYGPLRFALLPAAAQDARLPLTRINGVFEMGAAVAIVAGVVLAFSRIPSQATILTITGLNALTLVLVLPVRFPSDTRRPEPALQSVLGFFRDSGRIWRISQARLCLIGLASLRGLIIGFTGAMLAATGSHLAERDEYSGAWPQLLELGLWLGIGMAAGSLLVSWQKHPRRVLGLVPWGATALAGCLLLVALTGTTAPALCVVLGLAYAFVNVPLSATYQAVVPADARGNAMAVRNFMDYAVVALVAASFFLLAHLGLTPQGQCLILALLAAGLAALGWRTLFAEVLELAFEWLILPLYRISAHGPGLPAFPRDGPVLIVANHSAWLDPIWLAKVLPRPFVPMMTAMFFDLPLLRWLMVHVARAIRVETGQFRREMEELADAVAVLDRQEVLLIFPEGAMRKREDRPIMPFGQGVWRILQSRPETPVVVCWIEGGWGSYFSYNGGPPTKNKRFDVRRRIRIGVSEPRTLPAAILADRQETRRYLQGECLQARAWLGLEPDVVDTTETLDNAP